MHEADIERVTGNLRVHTANGLNDQEQARKKNSLGAMVVCLILGAIGGGLIAIGWILDTR